MYTIRGCKEGDASRPTAEAGSQASGDERNKLDWRSWLLPALPPSQTPWLAVDCPQPSIRLWGQGLCSTHPGDAQPAGWSREHHMSLLNKQSQMLHLYWPSQTLAQNGTHLKLPIAIRFAFWSNIYQGSAVDKHGNIHFHMHCLKMNPGSMSYEMRNWTEKGMKFLIS